MASRSGLSEGVARSRVSFPTHERVEYLSLPISRLASGERRLESENYLAEGYRLRWVIGQNVPAALLTELADVWQPSRLKGIQVDPDHGIPFLTATQVFDVRPTPRKWLAAKKTPNLRRRLVEPGWILVTCSGSVGDAAVSYAPLSGKIISHDLLRVQVREPEELGYLYFFLRSRFGRAMLRSSRYGSIVKHLEPAHLHDVPVPEASEQIRREAQNSILRVIELRNEASRLDAEAEARLVELCGLRSIVTQPSNSVRAIRLRSGSRRLDAYHYNEVAESIRQAFLSRQAAQRLADVTERVFGVPRFKHVYQSDGIPYLDSEDLFKLNPELSKFIPRSSLKTADRYLVSSGWLLMASSGQIYGLNGSLVIATERHQNKIVSNHVIRIVPRDIRPGYLAALLGHPLLGQPMVLSAAFGSSVPEIAPEDLADLPIVRLGADEDEIADWVERATALRDEASEIEDAAAELVERAVESQLASRGLATA